MEEFEWTEPVIEEAETDAGAGLAPLGKPNDCSIIPSFQVACDRLVCCQ